ncbi:MAG: peptide chain release factor N(5)-glutamine methyltransferase [Pseudomonadota bacterium]
MGADARTWTLMEVLRWTAGRFTGASDTPRLDAELLLAEVLGLGRVQLYTQFDRPLDRAELDRFKAQARRRIEGEPVAYILGRRDFWGRTFQVDHRVMVPRPETELLVQGALDAASADEEVRIIDLCTGSGNVIISILDERPRWRGIGADLSADALAVAAANREAADLVDRLELVEADLVDGVAADPRPLVITANPPYVPDGDWEGLKADVRDHEPRSAITAGPDGLDVIRRLLPAAAGALAPRGRLLMEYDGRAQTAAVRALAKDAGFEDITIVKDLAGLDRVLSARTSGQ